MLQIDPTLAVTVVAGALGTAAGSAAAVYRAMKKMFNGSSERIIAIQSTQAARFDEIQESLEEIIETQHGHQLSLYGLSRDIQEINTHGCHKFAIHAIKGKASS